MSVATHRDTQAGPLKLEYDVTPRDLSKSTDVPPLRNSNFRYKGYPGESFEKAKNPLYMTLEEEKQYSDFTNPTYNRKHQFDTRTSRAFGSPDRLQYGSDNMPPNDTEPKPLRGSLNEKSSAELRTFRQYQKDASEEFERLKAEKRANKVVLDEEKKCDLEMLKNYHPWGREGGGAPNNKQSHKKQKFTEEELEKLGKNPAPSQGLQELKSEYGDFNDGWGKPGNGAPRRTDSGQLRTSWKSDSSLRFRDKRVFDQEVRYKNDVAERQKYSKDLEQQMQENSHQKDLEKSTGLKEDQDMMKYDPFGKPGAGAPNKTQSGTAQPKRATTLTNDSNELKFVETKHGAKLNKVRSDEFGNYDPWGKGAGQPLYDQLGNTMRFPQSHPAKGIPTVPARQPEIEDEGGNSLDLYKGMGGAGAPIKTNSGRNVTRMITTLKSNERGDNTILERSARMARPVRMDDEEMIPYHPWGKGGGGAPVRDTSGNVQTNVYGNFRKPATYLRKSDIPGEGSPRINDPDYLVEIQRDTEQAQTRRKQHDRNLKYGAGEMATEMSKGQVGKPRRDPYTGMLVHQHLGTTDVTRGRVNEYPKKTPTTQNYHTELDRAAEERHLLKELEKMRDKQEATHHGSVSDNFWGRPGGGAPKGENKKANLDDMLYSPRRQGQFSGQERNTRSEPAPAPGHKDYYGKPTTDPRHYESENYYSKAYNPIHQPKNFVKNTVGSTSGNFYQVEPTGRRDRFQPSYVVPTPFATVDPSDI